MTRYVRFARNGQGVWGLLEGSTVRTLSAAPYLAHEPTGETVSLESVTLLAPAEPPKIFAVGLNYRSHLGNRPAPTVPEIFYKPITALQNPEAPIVIPPNASDVHYEGELVLVIGRTGRRIPEPEAPSYIFGVTCGNDVSEREWQRGAAKDLQWWRAKGCDTFGPCGPCLVRGAAYGNLKLSTRLNGETVQEQTTADLLFDAAAIVSFISQNVTLQPGDLIFTGTPGSTRRMKPGDVVEVEIQDIGVLRNPVEAG